MDQEAAELSVLLVEDNPGDARLIREMAAEASQAPARLAHVDRLAAALDRLSEPGIDVALLDLGLPDSQGLATFTQLRDAWPRLPIVVLSGQTDAGLALSAVREGAQDYLLKGHVDGESLGRALRYAVEHKRIEERQRFLSEASRALADSLEYEATLQCAVEAPVPVFADACAIRLVSEPGSPGRIVVHDSEPCREADLYRAAEQRPTHELAELGLAMSLKLRLAAHGRSLGWMWLLRSAARPAFTREEIDLLDELALRSALALENARLHRELQLAVRLRDEVLAATSHDLRSPISGAMLQGALLRRRLRADPPAADVHEKVIRGLDEIDAALARSLGMIQELLDAASLQAGRELQLERRQTDLVALARRAIADHQARTDFHTLDLKVGGEPLVGHWDPQRLLRVLDNLLGNAIKYSRRPDPTSIELAREADVSGEWAVVKVRDHGVGIPAAELERVFDRFYRGSNVARDVRGVGIGLSGVRQIVEQHGGSVSVESQEGVGSTFTVRLPLL